MTMKKYKGRISIGRFTGNIAPYKGVTIQLSDENSSNPVVEITLTIQEFGDVISGLGYTDCEFSVYSMKNIGKKLEVKTEKIAVKKYEHSDEEIKDLCKPFEVDGWSAHYGDFKNHHKISKNIVTVGFSRYV